NEAFEKLLCLRTDVEKALEKVSPKAAESLSHASSVLSVRESEPVATPARTVAKEEAKSASAPTVLDFETCLEQIWEQLIAVPPTRGRSMTTVKVGTARILLSSWEVAAFINEGGPSAEDLRRAVVARAIVTAATESARESGNASSVDRALSIARTEVSRL